MAQATEIEWTEQVWNFLRGCSRVSEGCTRCYAERQAIRHAGDGQPYHGLVRSTPGGPKWTGEVSFHEDILLAPLKRKKPTTYFVNSMSDLFHEKVKDEWLDKAFAVMALTPQHTYQILTKRPERMREYLSCTRGHGNVLARVILAARELPMPERFNYPEDFGWPYRNVWLGVSVEDQKTADERIPLLLQTPAAVRWISAEPLLSGVEIFKTGTCFYCKGWGEFSDGGPACEQCEGRGKVTGLPCVECNGTGDGWQAVDRNKGYPRCRSCNGSGVGKNKLDWLVVGGESGPNARPCDIAWIRSIVGQCKAAGVPVFVKQLGAKACQTPEDDGGTGFFLPLNDRKGGTPDEWPEDLRVRQFPNTRAEAANA